MCVVYACVCACMCVSGELLAAGCVRTVPGDSWRTPQSPRGLSAHATLSGVPWQDHVTALGRPPAQYQSKRPLPAINDWLSHRQSFSALAEVHTICYKSTLLQILLFSLEFPYFRLLHTFVFSLGLGFGISFCYTSFSFLSLLVSVFRFATNIPPLFGLGFGISCGFLYFGLLHTFLFNFGVLHCALLLSILFYLGLDVCILLCYFFLLSMFE